jgi:hypothetical protein
MRTGRPVFSTSKVKGDAAVIVRHREYLDDIDGTTAYDFSQYPLQPGIGQGFPWLSNMASNYESYTFRKLAYIYEPTCSTSTAGTVMMGIDYDAADDPPGSKTELMSFHGAVRSAPWASCCCGTDKRDLEKLAKQRYVRLGNLDPNLDLKTYDAGYLVIATQGMTSGATVGELFVEYEVEFQTPQLNINEILDATSSHLFTSTCTVANPFNGVVTTGGLGVLNDSSNTLTFLRAGKYLMVGQFIGTVMTGSLPTLAFSAQGSFINPDMGSTSGSASESTEVFLITVGPGEMVTFNYIATCTTLTRNEFRIAGYNY